MAFSFRTNAPWPTAPVAAAFVLAAVSVLPAQRFGPSGRVPLPALFGLHSANRVLLGDVDLDGDLDVVLPRFQQLVTPIDRHAVLVNEGAGRFHDDSAARMPTMASCIAHDAALVDVDLDGDLDLVLAHGAIGDHLRNAESTDPQPLQNRILLNDGTGRFQEALNAISSAEYVTYAIGVADFDGDGDPDLLTANYPYGRRGGGSWSGQNRFFENDGTGRFTERSGRLPADSFPERELATGDVDGDGDIDAMITIGGVGSSFGNRLAVYVNDGTGRFGLRMVPWPEARQAERLELFDADGDGDLDCVVMVIDDIAQPPNRSLAMLANDGSGIFRDVTTVVIPSADGMRPLDSSSYAAGELEPLDLEGDGDLDLAVNVHPGSRLFRNDGGRFVELPAEALPARWEHDASYGLCFRSNYTGSIASAAGDLDGDGRADLVAAHVYDLRIHLNTGRGSFEPVGEPAWGEEDLGDPAVGDVDGDGLPDLVVPSRRRSVLPGDAPLRVLLADGFGDHVDVSATHAPTFLPFDYMRAGESGASPLLADLDGDGDLDLLAQTAARTLQGYAYELRVWPNDGTGRFTAPWTRLPAAVESHAVRHLACADLDGDGDLDCVVVHQTSGPSGSAVFVCLNDGSGNFSNVPGLPPVVEVHRHVSIGDLDGDGLPELVLAGQPELTSSGWVNGQTRVWRNLGGGRFAEQVTGVPVEADHTWSTAVADIDADGDLDVLLANGGHGIECGPWQPGAPPAQNRLWSNDGSGSFADATATLPFETDRTVEIEVFDADEDGRLDLYYRNGYPPRLGTHERKFQESGFPPERNRLLLARANGYVDVSATALPDVAEFTVTSTPFDSDGDGDIDLLLESSAPVVRMYTLANEASQLRIPQQLKIGRPASVVGIRRPGRPTEGPFGLVVNLATRPGNFILPGVQGRLRVDPSSGIPVVAGTLPLGGGELSLSFQVPPIPALVDSQVFVQGAWVGPGGIRLTNALRETIGR